MCGFFDLTWLIASSDSSQKMHVWSVWQLGKIRKNIRRIYAYLRKMYDVWRFACRKNLNKNLGNIQKRGFCHRNSGELNEVVLQILDFSDILNNLCKTTSNGSSSSVWRPCNGVATTKLIYRPSWHISFDRIEMFGRYLEMFGRCLKSFDIYLKVYIPAIIWRYL